MGKNIQYQFLTAINVAFSGGGKDKHSIRASGGNTAENVYSFAERKNLVDLSAQFASFMKLKHPTIKMVKDIKSGHIQEFLYKKAGNCSGMTLSQYAARIRKLETLVNKRYKLELNWRDIVVPASQVAKNFRNIDMDPADLKKIKDSIEGSKSQAVIAIDLADRFGFRVTETVKLQPRDVNFENMKIHVHDSKGGRSRNVTIRPEDVPFLEKLIKDLGPKDKIIGIKEDSVNRFLSRCFKKLGMLQYVAAKSGVHLIRKMRAQLMYDELRSKGMSRTKCLDTVSEYLGHGKNRDECMKTYVLNAW